MNVKIVITKAGLQEVINAEKSGTAPVILSAVGFGTAQYTPDENQTELKEEFKRIDASHLSGGHVGDNTIYLTAKDVSNDYYSLYEFGVYTESGTLFALCSQNIPIAEKAADSHFYLDIEFALTGADPDSVSFGDTNFFNPPATTQTPGVVKLATAEETAKKSDSEKAVTPSALNGLKASETASGLVSFATAAEIAAAIETNKAISPAGLLAAFGKLHGQTGFQKMPNGLILQWGRALVSDSETIIYLPTNFPNLCVFAAAVPYSEDGIDPVPTMRLWSMNAGALTFKHNGNGGVDSMWFALGY